MSITQHENKLPGCFPLFAPTYCRPDLAIAGIFSKTPAAKPHMDGLAGESVLQRVKRAQIHLNDFSTPRCVIRNPATGPTHDDPRSLPSTTTACVPRLIRCQACNAQCTFYIVMFNVLISFYVTFYITDIHVST